MSNSTPQPATRSTAPTEGPIESVVEGGDTDASSFEQRYHLEERLGEGGMGAVSLMRDHLIGRYVAVKQIRKGVSHGEGRFIREARVQGQLEHPNIVPVYDLIRRSDGRHAISMRAVEGDTLADVVDADPNDGEYPLHRLLSAFTQVCLAVDYAHKSAVVHRDLKPDNIMFGDFGAVYLLDWGIAQRFDPGIRAADANVSREQLQSSVEEHTTSLVGTPGYMAPEQVVGAQLVGPWTDVYALGCVLFEMITRQRLNGGAEPRDRIRAVLEEPNFAEYEMVPELERICRRATAFVPAERYGSARELHDAVDAYLGGERDVELRRKLSADLADKAAEATRRDDGVEQRRTAMRHLGRALALDPENDAAVRRFLALLAKPPRDLPRDAHPATDADRRRGFRQAARYAIGVHLSFLAMVPVLAWATPLAWWMVAMAGFALVSTALSWLIARGRDSERMVVLMMLASTTCLAFTAGAFGPLLVAPFMVAVNTCVYCTLLRRRARMLCLVAGMMALSVPCALELFGVTRSYAFEAGGLRILQEATPNAVPTIIFFVMASLGAILGGGISCSFVRDALERAERKLRIQAWHLRQALPAVDRDAGS